MYTINDPMFSLILRFVGDRRKVAFHDDEFIHKQLKAIRKYVSQFPSEEQELRAIEWIEAYAQKYRENWEKNIINKTFSNDRCPDCPLARINGSGHCQVHDEWLKLLHRHATNKISSKEYVKNALHLLTQHKENLKIKLSALRGEHN